MELDDSIKNEIEQFEEETAQEPFPQYLCKMCGKCCKSITTNRTFEELKVLAEQGSTEAIEFVETFKPFPSIEEARKVVPEQIDQVLKILKNESGFNIEKVTFYYCPFINEDNKCTIYERRPNCCRRAPSHGWSAMPPGCGFEGWQFEQREKHKRMIRSIKEYFYTIESLSKDGKVPGKDQTIEELKAIIDAKIKPWERFGALFW